MSKTIGENSMKEALSLAVKGFSKIDEEKNRLKEQQELIVETLARQLLIIFNKKFPKHELRIFGVNGTSWFEFDGREVYSNDIYDVLSINRGGLIHLVRSDEGVDSGFRFTRRVIAVFPEILDLWEFLFENNEWICTRDYDGCCLSSRVVVNAL